MSTVDSDYIEEGDVSSVTDMNAVYTAIETASLNIDGENTRSEWVSLKHLNDNVVLVDGDNDGVSITTITSTTYVASGTEVVSYTLEAGDVLRFHSNIASGENVVAAPTAQNYWFAFYWTRDDGSGPVTEQIGPDHCYSFLSRNSGGASQQYNYQRHGFSYVYIHTGATRTITMLGVYAKVEDATNELHVITGHSAFLHIRGG